MPRRNNGRTSISELSPLFQPTWPTSGGATGALAAYHMGRVTSWLLGLVWFAWLASRPTVAATRST